MRTAATLYLMLLTGASGAACAATSAAEPDRFADVVVKSTAVGGSVSMLTGAGGNLAVSIGPDGTLLVDDQFAELSSRIQNSINALGGAPPKLTINTHFHGDHIGGNGAFGVAGAIIAQEQVRFRLINDATLPRAAMPIVTFTDQIRVHFNNDEIDVIHLAAGHTDGDSIVWFHNANVLHMGDLFFNGSFPRIDLEHGGTVDGYLANVAAVLEMIPADTRIIPGHGALANVVELGEFHDMLKDTVTTIRARIAGGESVDAIVANGLGPEWARFGGGFINEEAWVKTINQASTPSAEAGTRRR